MNLYFIALMVLCYVSIVVIVLRRVKFYNMKAKEYEELRDKKEVTNEDLLNTIYFLFTIIMIVIVLK